MEWDKIVPGCLQGENNTVPTLQCIPAVFQNVVSGLLLFAGLTALIIIILQGYKIITSGGDPKQLDSAKHSLAYAILGLAIILFSFLLLNLISTITHTPCILKFGFSNC